MMAAVFISSTFSHLAVLANYPLLEVVNLDAVFKTFPDQQ
jgi:hypothetical protein